MINNSALSAPLRLCERSSGLILLNKSAGITSFDSLKCIKRSLKTGKVGHTGTLDKFAHGLLIVLVGKALRLSQWFTACDKKYKGRIYFGIETDTLDPEGAKIAEAALPSRNDIEKVLSQFTGSILQAPPIYSAIHVNGKRASDLARAGLQPEMKKRPVTIHKLELLSWEPPFADIFVHCSSGTYIRSLVRDIALAAGSRAHLSELQRTHIGGFELSDKRLHAGDTEKRRARLNENEENEENEDINVFPIDKSVIKALGMPYFDVSPDEAVRIRHGKPLSLPVSSSLNNAAIFCEETLLAIVKQREGTWEYGCVLT